MTDKLEVLKFWFGDGYEPGGDEPAIRKVWFQKDDDFDALIADRFGDDVQRASRGDYDSWADTAVGRLALIIVLDQFPRNLFRGSPRSWTRDILAQRLSLRGIEEGHNTTLGVVERAFFYLPLEHAEDRHLQGLSVDKYGELVERDADRADGFYEYAVAHREIVERFGRFPHRNEVIGRPSTPEEKEFLKQPGSSF